MNSKDREIVSRLQLSADRLRQSIDTLSIWQRAAIRQPSTLEASIESPIRIAGVPLPELMKDRAFRWGVRKALQHRGLSVPPFYRDDPDWEMPRGYD